MRTLSSTRRGGWALGVALCLQSAFWLQPPPCFGAAASSERARSAALFVITRSSNANVLHYEALLDARGNLDPDHPLAAYWVMRAEDGHREELTWFERQFAYGWSLTSPVGQRRVAARLSAVPQRELLVVVDVAGRARVSLRIAGHSALLESVFVQLEPGGGLPSVRFVELRGVDAVSGQAVRERLEP
jgi:hypothetical protein